MFSAGIRKWAEREHTYKSAKDSFVLLGIGHCQCIKDPEKLEWILSRVTRESEKLEELHIPNLHKRLKGMD